MIRTFSALAVSFALIATASVASAAENYVSGAVASNVQDFSVDNVDIQAASVAVGRDYGKVRAEVEYVHLGDVQTNDVRANIVNVNGYVEPFTFGRVTPFVGAGIGYASLGGAAVNGDADGFVYNASVGANFALTQNLSVNTQYRFTKSTDLNVFERSGTLGDFEDESVFVGVRYTF